MQKLSDEEKTVLLALSELEPASLEQIAVKTGIKTQLLKAILEKLASKALLHRTDEDCASPE
jgi:DNA-binding MarR family transcriptional regulator